MMEWLKIDKEIAAVTYDSVWKAFTEDGSLPENGLRVAIEEAKRVGKVDRDVPFNEVADLSLLREAQKELGIPAKSYLVYFFSKAGGPARSRSERCATVSPVSTNVRVTSAAV